jgi:hypothetical protein
MTAEMMEIMMDESIEQGEYPPRFQNMSLTVESRKKNLKSCLELKRIFDKDSVPIPADSQIQKCLFSKTPINISILFRCLKEYLELDTCIVITNLLIRLITASENASTNVSLMAKKNLCPILLQCIQAIYSEHFSNQNGTNLSVNVSQRIDEVFLNVFTLISKLSKFDPKVALLAR